MPKLCRRASLPVLLATFVGCKPWAFLEGYQAVGHRILIRSRQRILRRAETVSIPRSEKFPALQKLGLDPTNSPTAAEVKKAFRRKVARLHPDLKGGRESPEFREVLDAYAVLTGRRSSAGASRSTSDPFSSGFDLRRSTGGKTEAEREAEFQRPENWRWDQNAGYNPGDLEEVWAEIGYNPYTGEYREAPERAEAEEADWVPEPEPTRRSPPKPQPRRYPAWSNFENRSRRFGLARASDIPDPLPFLQIALYLLLAVVCSFFVLAPEQLLSEEDRAKRLAELEEREQILAQQQEERIALEILWRQKQQEWQREQLQGFAEYAPEPINELELLEDFSDETQRLFAPQRSGK